MSDEVVLAVGGLEFAGWEEIAVQRSLECIASSFHLIVAADRVLPINRGASCTLTVGGDLLITGWVDRVGIDLAEENHKTTVEGRDLTADLVDCSASSVPGEWYGLPLEEIALEIAQPFAVDVFTDIDTGLGFERYAVQPGETAFEAIERACRLRGVLPISDARGRLLLTRPGQQRAAVDLIEGKNVKTCAANFDDSGRFHDYFVRGQQPPGADEFTVDECAGPEGFAQDLGVRSRRALVILAEGILDEETADRRAEWEATVRAARAATFTVTVQGWRQTPLGELWAPGIIVNAELPSLGHVGDLLVRAVRHTLALGRDQGTQSELVLVRPDAYLPQPILRIDLDPSAFGAALEEG